MKSEWVCNKLTPEDKARMLAVPDFVIQEGLEKIRIEEERKRRANKELLRRRAESRIARKERRIAREERKIAIEERRIIRQKMIAKKKRDKKRRGGTLRGPDSRLRSVCRRKSDIYIPMPERRT